MEVILTESLSCVSTVSYFFTSDDVHECSCKALWVATGQGKPEQIQFCVCERECVCPFKYQENNTYFVCFVFLGSLFF